MATVTPYPRLCLSKDSVYIDLLEAVAPNVLNGVRFLYKQFVQKPGVIINDPPGCDQETQVVMFLRGIHKGLDQQHKPVLILCHSSKLAIWMDCLLKWIPNYDEVVAIDLPKPTTKKSIYVITTDRLESYFRREWGVAVIDDDAFLQYTLQPNTFTVLFKIFITTDDLREYLTKFAQIHKWLYPDMHLDIDKFRPKKQNISEYLEKRIWFSAFAEDLIVRCDKQGPVKYQESVEPSPPAPRITRKNKDATGTKIKRTKRKAEDDNTESANKKIIVNNNPESRHTGSCATKIVINDDNEENMDIESFIREREPIKMDELKDIPDIDSIPLASDKSDVVEEKPEELEENSNDMKLNYSEELDTEDAAYDLETQEDALGNNELQSKENEELQNNELEKEVVNIKSNVNDSTDDIEDKAQTKDVIDNTPIENIIAKDKFEENTESNNLTDASDLENAISNSKETNDAQNETKLESKDEVKPVKENGVKKEGTKSDDLDSKWEEMAFKKFKGSLLDRIF